MSTTATMSQAQMNFSDLEMRYGYDAAVAIVKTLEQFEGVVESRVSRLSPEMRLENVMKLMSENVRPQTRH